MIEFDNHIKNFDELIKQLESLKDEAIYMMKAPYHDEVFIKDFHALKIAINFLREEANKRKCKKYTEGIKENEKNIQEKIQN